MATAMTGTTSKIFERTRPVWVLRYWPPEVRMGERSDKNLVLLQSEKADEILKVKRGVEEAGGYVEEFRRASRRQQINRGSISGDSHTQ